MWLVGDKIVTSCWPRHTVWYTGLTTCTPFSLQLQGVQVLSPVYHSVWRGKPWCNWYSSCVIELGIMTLYGWSTNTDSSTHCSLPTRTFTINVYHGVVRAIHSVYLFLVCDFSRYMFYMMNIILPCVLLSTLILIVFCVPPDAGEKIGYFGAPRLHRLPTHVGRQRAQDVSRCAHTR